MDATELLKKDHDKVRALFQQFRGGGGITGLVKRVTGNVSPRQRRSAVKNVCKELEVHTRIEEHVFYPAVRAVGDPELGRQVDEGIREHATVKEQVAALQTTEDGGDDLDDRMGKLEECVEHHATEEEREMFPRLQELMPEEERTQLGRRLQAAKRAGGASTPARPRAAATSRTRKTVAEIPAGTRRRPVRRGRTSVTSAAKKTKTPKRARGGRRR